MSKQRRITISPVIVRLIVWVNPRHKGLMTGATSCYKRLITGAALLIAYVISGGFLNGLLKKAKQIFVAIRAIESKISRNSTPHASRQICAPRGVTFFLPLFLPFLPSSPCLPRFAAQPSRPLPPSDWRDLPLWRGKV